MRKIDTSGITDPSKKQPFTGYSLSFLQDMVKEIGILLLGGSAGDSYNLGSNYAIYGVVKSGTAYSAGAIYANGEIYSFSGGNTAGFVNTGVFVISETSAGAPYDPITYSDSSSGNVHLNRIVVLQDLTNGSGVADLSSLVYIQRTIVRTKIVDIGTWNMDSTISVNVAHGLTLSKIRGVTCTIIDDNGTGFENFERPIQVSASDFSQQDGQIVWGAVNIALSRRTGGVFDSTTYDSTAANRGYVVITYVD